MRRLIIFLAALTVSAGLCAQTNDWGWPDTHSRSEINIDKENNNVTIDRNMYIWRPFDDVVGYSIYGSRYRRAKANYGWGMFTTLAGTALSGLWTAFGIGNIEYDDNSALVMCSTGAIALAASLWGGIHMWRRGRQELDWMLDDYALRYGPRPYAATFDFGPTRSGIGLALNF